MKSRNGHYFQWFIVFGVIAGIVSFLDFKGTGFPIDSEAIWLLGAGILGLIIAHNSLKNGDFARYYDFIIGVIFMVAGLVGIAAHISQVSSTISQTAGGLITGSGEQAHLLGLSLGLFPAIVHLLLGFTSFRHGMDNGKK